MDEPQRIGLTKEANAFLDEMLETINSVTEGTSEKLIKFDLYRLAVAIGVNEGNKPKPINGNADGLFRIGELDPDKTLYIAVEAAGLNDSEGSVYRGVERLAEQGIRLFYKSYQENMERLPWDKILA